VNNAECELPGGEGVCPGSDWRSGGGEIFLITLKGIAS